MLADFKIVLDACVLANISVCDLFLRLAEKPRLFLPKWSSTILDEVKRVQSEKLNWSAHLVKSWREEVTHSFPDATVDDFSHLLAKMSNDEKDRHVLAATICAGASVVVTFNLKDFPAGALTQWGIEACHPQDYLLTLYSMSPKIVVHRLYQMARKREMELIDLVIILGKTLPNFSSHIIDDLALE